METIPKSDCVQIGTFLKPHGVFGTLQLSFEAGLEESVETASCFLVETDGLLVPWFTAEEGVRITSAKTALVQLDWVGDDTAARKLCGKPVFLLQEEIAEEDIIPEESFWLDWQVYDAETGRLLGEVTEVNNYAGNLVLTIKTLHGEKLVPLSEGLVQELDEAKKTIKLMLPEGLLDL